MGVLWKENSTLVGDDSVNKTQFRFSASHSRGPASSSSLGWRESGSGSGSGSAPVGEFVLDPVPITVHLSTKQDSGDPSSQGSQIGAVPTG